MGNDTGTRALTKLLALSLPAHVARLLCCNFIHTSNLADFETGGGDDEGVFQLISASIVVNHVNQLSTGIKPGGPNITLDKRDV